MLLTRETSLEQLLVETLAKMPNERVEEIRRHLLSRSQRFSVQGIYKELRKLERKGVVIRRSGRYMLRYLWLIELEEFAKAGQAAFRRSEALMADVPAEGEVHRWVLPNLQHVLDLWTDLTFRLVRTLPLGERLLCEAVEYIWFHAVHPVNETHFLRAMQRENVRYQLISQHNTFMDRTYVPILKELGATYSLGDRGFRIKAHQYFSVLGDYVIEVRLTRKLIQAVEELYSNVQSSRDLSPQKLLALSRAHAPCSVVLRCHAKAAARERARFNRFFG